MAGDVLDFDINFNDRDKSYLRILRNFQTAAARHPIDVNIRAKQNQRELGRSVRKPTQRLKRDFSKTNQQIDQTNKRLFEYAKNTRSASKATATFGDRLGFTTNRLAAYIVPAAAIFQLARGFRFASDTVVSLNKDISRLSQILGNNSKLASKYSQDVLATAERFGQSGQELLNISTLLAQSGNKFKGENLTKAVRAIAQTPLVSTFGSLEETTRGVIAALNQFNKTGDETNGILDVANDLAKNFAVQSADIFQAVTKGGKAIQVGGGTFEDFAALVSSVKQLTGLNTSTIGTGFRTIFLRLFRSENIKLLESFENVDLRNTQGQLKDVVGILKEAANAYTTLDKVGKQALSERLFGVRRSGLGIPLLEDIAKGGENSVTLKALRTSRTATGSLAEDATVGLDRISSSVGRIRASFEELFGELSTSDELENFFKNAANAAESFSSVLQNIQSVIFPLIQSGGLLLAGTAVKSLPAVGRGLGLNSAGPLGAAIKNKREKNSRINLYRQQIRNERNNRRRRQSTRSKAQNIDDDNLFYVKKGREFDYSGKLPQVKSTKLEYIEQRRRNEERIAKQQNRKLSKFYKTSPKTSLEDETPTKGTGTLARDLSRANLRQPETVQKRNRKIKERERIDNQLNNNYERRLKAENRTYYLTEVEKETKKKLSSQIGVRTKRQKELAGLEKDQLKNQRKLSKLQIDELRPRLGKTLDRQVSRLTKLGGNATDTQVLNNLFPNVAKQGKRGYISSQRERASIVRDLLRRGGGRKGARKLIQKEYFDKGERASKKIVDVNQKIKNTGERMQIVGNKIDLSNRAIDEYGAKIGSLNTTRSNSQKTLDALIAKENRLNVSRQKSTNSIERYNSQIKNERQSLRERAIIQGKGRIGSLEGLAERDRRDARNRAFSGSLGRGFAHRFDRKGNRSLRESLSFGARSRLGARRFSRGARNIGASAVGGLRNIAPTAVPLAGITGAFALAQGISSTELLNDEGLRKNFKQRVSQRNTENISKGVLTGAAGGAAFGLAFGQPAIGAVIGGLAGSLSALGDAANEATEALERNVIISRQKNNEDFGKSLDKLRENINKKQAEGSEVGFAKFAASYLRTANNYDPLRILGEYVGSGNSDIANIAEDILTFRSGLTQSIADKISPEDPNLNLTQKTLDNNSALKRIIASRVDQFSEKAFLNANGDLGKFRSNIRKKLIEEFGLANKKLIELAVGNLDKIAEKYSKTQVKVSNALESVDQTSIKVTKRLNSLSDALSDRIAKSQFRRKLAGGKFDPSALSASFNQRFRSSLENNAGIDELRRSSGGLISDETIRIANAEQNARDVVKQNAGLIKRTAQAAVDSGSETKTDDFTQRLLRKIEGSFQNVGVGKTIATRIDTELNKLIKSGGYKSVANLSEQELVDKVVGEFSIFDDVAKIIQQRIQLLNQSLQNVDAIAKASQAAVKAYNNLRKQASRTKLTQLDRSLSTGNINDKEFSNQLRSFSQGLGEIDLASSRQELSDLTLKYAQVNHEFQQGIGTQEKIIKLRKEQALAQEKYIKEQGKAATLTDVLSKRFQTLSEAIQESTNNFRQNAGQTLPQRQKARLDVRSIKGSEVSRGLRGVDQITDLGKEKAIQLTQLVSRASDFRREQIKSGLKASGRTGSLEAFSQIEGISNTSFALDKSPSSLINGIFKKQQEREKVAQQLVSIENQQIKTAQIQVQTARINASRVESDLSGFVNNQQPKQKDATEGFSKAVDKLNEISNMLSSVIDQGKERIKFEESLTKLLRNTGLSQREITINGKLSFDGLENIDRLSASYAVINFIDTLINTFEDDASDPSTIDFVNRLKTAKQEFSNAN